MTSDADEDDGADGARYACVDCGAPVAVGDATCPDCGHGHVDRLELWATIVLSPPVYLLFAVLVLWALATFLPTTSRIMGPRAVAMTAAALWLLAILQFAKDHVDYRRAVAASRGATWYRAGALPAPPLDDRLDRLSVTVRVGAGVALVAVVGGAVAPGPGYRTALSFTGLAGLGLLLYGAGEVYRLRDELRLRRHLNRVTATTRRRCAGAARRVAGATRTAATGAAPYVAELARGSRSLASDLGVAARRLRAAGRQLHAGFPADAADLRAAGQATRRLSGRATASMRGHWPAWGVAGIVELWLVAFASGVGVTYLTETMLVTWITYTYFLFEDVAVTRDRYDYDPWWWSYSVLGLLPIVNIGVGAVYLLRRELVRRARAGEASTESRD